MADKLEFKKIATLHDRTKAQIPVIQIQGPYGGPVLFYQCALNVDWDGSATAYGVDRPGFPLQSGLNPHEQGVAGLFGSGKGGDGSWAGVFSATETEARTILTSDANFGPDPKARLALLPSFLDTRFKDVNGRFPVVQITDYNSRVKGYYVSQCNAIANPGKRFWDQHLYHDAATVAYGALSDGLKNLGPGLNDFGLIIRNSTGKSIGFFFGDRSGSGSDKVGECSGLVKTTIAPDANGEDKTFSFFVFPGSGKGVPPNQAPDLIDMNVTYKMRSMFMASNAHAVAVLTALGSGAVNSRQTELTPAQKAAYLQVKPAFMRLGWDPDGSPFEYPDVDGTN